MHGAPHLPIIGITQVVLPSQYDAERARNAAVKLHEAREALEVRRVVGYLDGIPRELAQRPLLPAARRRANEPLAVCDSLRQRGGRGSGVVQRHGQSRERMCE